MLTRQTLAPRMVLVRYAWASICQIINEIKPQVLGNALKTPFNVTMERCMPFKTWVQFQPWITFYVFIKSKMFLKHSMLQLEQFTNHLFNLFHSLTLSD